MKYWWLSLGIIAVVLSWFQFSTMELIGNDDVYWHIRYSEQYFSSLDGFKEFLADPIPYFGFSFHFILGLFTIVFPVLIASKVAGIILALGVFAALGLLMQRLRVPFVGLWLLLLFFGSINFSFRLLLVRTFLLSLILLFVGMYFIVGKNKLGVLGTGILYGLSYVAAPFLVIVAALKSLILWIYDRSRDFNLVYPALVGVVIGFMLNPAWSGTLAGLIRYLIPALSWVPSDRLNVGVEFYGYELQTFFSHELLIALVWLPSVYLAIVNLWKRKLSPEASWTQLLAVLSFIGALFARRFIEYWAPMAILGAAVTYAPYLSKIHWQDLKGSLRKHIEVQMAAMLLISIVGFLGYRTIDLLRDWTIPPESIQRYRNVGLYLEEHAEPGAMVFNLDWSHYPKYYFWNPKNDYLIKFDPTTLYIDDEELYWQWRNIADDWVGIYSPEELHQFIKFRSNTSYVLLDRNGYFAFQDKLDYNEQLFSKLYDDGEFVLYRVN